MTAWEIGALVFTSMGVGGLLDIAYAKWLDKRDLARKKACSPPTIPPGYPRGASHKCANCGPDVDWSFGDDKAAKLHVPPMTATWPARWVEVNGFRYVLDEKEQGR